ncbi:MAG: aldo/keto reductase [Gaiellaceae bacterium]
MATRLGVGGGPLGGLFSPVSSETVEAVIERAWEHGVRLFDVAPLYGHGRTERFVGRVLQTKPRDEFVVSTKVGRLLRAEAAGAPSDFAETEGVGPVFDFSAAGVRRSFEESLERLGLDRVDVVYLHDPEEHLDQALREALPELVRLRDEGLVAGIGVGTNSVDTVVRFVRETDVDCVLLANRLTLLDRSGEAEALPLCAERNVAVIAGGVFNSGVLASPRASPTYEYAPAPDDVRDRALALERICEQYGVPLAAAAVQFPLRDPVVASVVVGVRSVAELDENVAAFHTPLPAELWGELLRHG